MRANVLPANMGINQDVRWSSNGPSVATIDEETGVIHAIKPGSITIIATSVLDSTVRGTFQLTVVAAPKYNLTIYHRYDEGYIVRFPNTENLIQSYQNVVSSILLDNFSLQVTHSIEPYRSIADRCRNPLTIPDLIKPCSNLFFKCILTIDEVRDEMWNLYSKNIGINETAMAWTGHLLDGNPLSTSYSGKRVVVMTIAATTSQPEHNNFHHTTVRRELIYELLHEISHQLGAKDHYCHVMDLNKPVCNISDCWNCIHRQPENPNDCVMVFDIIVPNIEALYASGSQLFCTRCSGPDGTITNHLKNNH
jgi:hypothetical protein